MREPVLRSVAMESPGIGWPSYLSSMGLGSKLSTDEQPPFMKRKITRLTRCGSSSLATATPPSDVVTPARATDCPTIPAKASMPKPLPMRQSASRRVTGLAALWKQFVFPQSMYKNSLELNRIFAYGPQGVAVYFGAGTAAFFV